MLNLSTFSYVHLYRAGQQLTLFDSKLFQDIQPVEFINHLVMDKIDTKLKGSGRWMPHLQKFIRRFDQESFWVAAEVAHQDGAKHQALMIEKFAQVAKYCLAVNNLFSIFAIIGALDFDRVRNLTDAWALVPKKALKIIHRVSLQLRNDCLGVCGCFNTSLGLYFFSTLPLYVSAAIHVDGSDAQF